MKQRKILFSVATIGLLLLTGLVLAFSPLTPQLFQPDSNSDWLEDIVGLVGFVIVLAGTSALGITSIVACCYLGKRLGYDPYAGLLLLFPPINVFVFFYWAFKESPNEQRLRLYLGRKEATNR